MRYTADHENGYNADVSYYGEAQYPPKSDKAPFVVEKQSYKPKPQPSYN